jgi:His-Xaa-Ser system protein HxsD
MAADAARTTVVRFATGVFDVDCIKRAAYQLSDRLLVEIEPSSDEIVCTLRTVVGKTSTDEIENEFRRAVLDHDLRATIAKETERVRNLVLAIAFSKTGVQG